MFSEDRLVGGDGIRRFLAKARFVLLLALSGGACGFLGDQAYPRPWQAYTTCGYTTSVDAVITATLQVFPSTYQEDAPYVKTVCEADEQYLAEYRVIVLPSGEPVPEGLFDAEAYGEPTKFCDDKLDLYLFVGSPSLENALKEAFVNGATVC